MRGMPRLALLLLVLLPVPYLARAAALETVRAMEFPHGHHAGIELHAGDGNLTEARQLAEVLDQAGQYFSTEFGIEETFSLAYLDREAWTRVTHAPYGMPFVSGPPYVVVFATTPDNELYRLVDEALAESDLALQYGLEQAQLVDLFISLIGFHELGHVYARESGLPHPEKWIFEFNATYLAYAFLQQERPDWAEFWTAACGILAERLQPRHRTLDRFEELYVRVGTESYAWYQCVFLQRAAAVFASRGLELMELMRAPPGPKSSGMHYLDWMDGLEPGFVGWARQHGMID